MSLHDFDDDNIPECTCPEDKTSHISFKDIKINLPGEFILSISHGIRHGILFDRYIGEKTYGVSLLSKAPNQYVNASIAVLEDFVGLAVHAPEFTDIDLLWFQNIIRLKSGLPCNRKSTDINSGRMPDKKFQILQRELAKLLQRFQIPELVAEQFIAQTAKQLRSALKSHAKRSLSVPDRAAKRWPDDRLRDENPVAFVQRIYGQQIDHGGMTQSHLAAIDKKALNALRNYCANRHARPMRPHVSQILPPSKKNPDDVVAKYGQLTWANSVGAYDKNPTRENLERKRAFKALDTRKSRARNHDPT